MWPASKNHTATPSNVLTINMISLKKPRLSSNQIKIKSKAILYRYMNELDLKEAMTILKDSFDKLDLKDFVREIILESLEKEADEPKHAVGVLLKYFSKYRLISKDDFLEGFSEVLDSADNLELDKPHVWKHLAEILINLCNEKCFSLEEITIFLAQFNGASLYCNLLSRLLEVLMNGDNNTWGDLNWFLSNIPFSYVIDADERKICVEELCLLIDSKICELQTIRNKLDQSNVKKLVVTREKSEVNEVKEKFPRFKSISENFTERGELENNDVSENEQCENLECATVEKWTENDSIRLAEEFKIHLSHSEFEASPLQINGEIKLEDSTVEVSPSAPTAESDSTALKKHDWNLESLSKEARALLDEYLLKCVRNRSAVNYENFFDEDNVKNFIRDIICSAFDKKDDPTKLLPAGDLLSHFIKSDHISKNLFLEEFFNLMHSKADIQHDISVGKILSHLFCADIVSASEIISCVSSNKSTVVSTDFLSSFLKHLEERKGRLCMSQSSRSAEQRIVSDNTLITFNDKNEIISDEDKKRKAEDLIIAPKNEEDNNKKTASEKTNDSSHAQVIENVNKSEVPVLKLTYKDGQWSPMNLEGKKKYDREFIMALMHDPQSKKKPKNFLLKELLKDNKQRHPNRNFLNYVSRGHGDSLLQHFPHKNWNQRAELPRFTKRLPGSKEKLTTPPEIHSSPLSVDQDVKLHEAENPWKPSRLMDQNNITEEEVIYTRVLGVLNKLTLQKFLQLMGQVQALPINNLPRLQGVIDLVFKKAVSEPMFSVVYARMCQILQKMNVPSGNFTEDGMPIIINFKKLLLDKCQHEFEKNTAAELKRDERLKEISAETDPEKKNILQLSYEEEERRIRMKSLGNIRFIGELYELGIMADKTMRSCIKSLINGGDEESLECLCILLTTIGQRLEKAVNDDKRIATANYGELFLKLMFFVTFFKRIDDRDSDNKEQNLEESNKQAARKQQDAETALNNFNNYFKRLNSIVENKGIGSNKISSRVRFMIQDLIDLRNNKWTPRRDDSNVKTIEGGPDIDGWTTVGMSTPNKTRFSVESCKIKIDQQTLQATSSWSRNQIVWGPGACGGKPEDINAPYAPLKSKLNREEVAGKVKTIFEGYLDGHDLKKTTLNLQDSFNESNFKDFIKQILCKSRITNCDELNLAVGKLLSHFIKNNDISKEQFLEGFSEMLDIIKRYGIYLSSCYESLSIILVHVCAVEVVLLQDIAATLTQHKGTTVPIKCLKYFLKLLVKVKGNTWVEQKWMDSNVSLEDIMNPKEVDNFIKENKLEFLLNSKVLELDTIKDEIRRMITAKESFDSIKAWIEKNVGAERTSMPEFTRTLITAILEAVVSESTQKVDLDLLSQCESLIRIYTDRKEEKELPCLFAVQAFVHKLEHPEGLMHQIFEFLFVYDLVATESFKLWRESEDPHEREGHDLCTKSLTSFFTLLDEPDTDEDTKS